MADWRHRARCRSGSGIDPELFFPIGQGEGPRQQVQEARAVCARCPAVWQCLDWATAHNVEGVWGGTTKEERDNIRRRMRAQRIAS